MEKKDIALQQLIDAAKLYNKGRYVSALTLAGASEEILGKIAKKRIGSNQLENEKEGITCRSSRSQPRGPLRFSFSLGRNLKRELLNRIINIYFLNK